MKKKTFFVTVMCAAALLCGCSERANEVTKLDDESSSSIEEIELSPDSLVVTDSDADSSETDSSIAEDSSSEEEVELTPEEQQAEWDKLIEETVAGMSNEEKVGQLFIVRPDALDTSYLNYLVHNDETTGVTEINDSIKESLEKYHVGGVVLFPKNVTDEKQIKKLNKELQKASNIPLFIAAGEEGGSRTVIAGTEGFDVKTFESMNAVGAKGDTKAAKEVGTTIGGYLKKYGIDLDLAPVADIYSDPNNNVIGTRSFGSDPKTVSDMVGAELDGLHEKGVMGTLKHFPGFGEVAGGTKWVMAISNKNWVQLMENELQPFIYNSQKTDMIMVGHVKLPKVTKDDLPASMSGELMSKLRNDLAYDGVVITDDMSGYVITNLYDSDKAAVMAITAGADIILSPYDIENAYQGVLDAVNTGVITQDRLDQSVERIIRLKVENGLFDQ